MAAIKRWRPELPLEVWAFDEHRVGLEPIRRRVWAKRGERPLAVSHHKYQWLYLYGFVRPRTGALQWWIADGVNVELFERMLASFAARIGAGTRARVILCLDNAGWHVAEKLKRPPGIHFRFLPPYTPELQPAERLWPLTDEPIVNKPFPTLDALEEVLDHRCLKLIEQPQLISDHTLFHWWPEE